MVFFMRNESSGLPTEDGTSPVIFDLKIDYGFSFFSAGFKVSSLGYNIF
jgi:hypothetical protein